jgi:hypothetical protein
MDDASRDSPIPSIEFQSYHPVTDGAMSPPVRTHEHVLTRESHKRTFSVMEKRATLDEPTRRQSTLTESYQTTKSGFRHYTSTEDGFERPLQKGRLECKTHSSTRPATQANKLNGHQPEQQNNDEVRRKVAEAAQQRQRLSAIRDRTAARNQRQRSEDMQIEQEAWNDRASATAKSSTTKPARQAALPGAAALRPQPSAPTKPKPNGTKRPSNAISQCKAGAKALVKRKRAEEAEVRNERTRVADDDTSDEEAQREAEANHALSKPPPYVSVRNNTVQHTNDDAKPQAFHDDGFILEPSAQDHDDERQSMHTNPPEGPFSLNSAAGIQAVKRTVPRPMVLPYDDVPAKTAAQRFMGTKDKTPFAKKATKSNPGPFPITAQDLQLYKWRAEKVMWAEVLQRWAKLTGSAVSREDTLRARFRQVEKLIDTEDITTEMCQAVIDGDKDAETELNRLAALHAPNSAGAGSGQSLPFKKIGKQEPVVRSARSSLPPVPPVPPVPPAAPLAHPAPLALPAPRPTEGVKSFDHDAYAALLQNARDVYATSSDDDDEDELLRGSPPAEEDCVRWEYFMQRRDLVSDNLEEEYEHLDVEVPWTEYNAAFDQAGHANAEAMIFIFTTPAGAPEIFKPDEYFAMIHKRPSEGMMEVDLKTDRGMVQVRVNRRMLTFQDHLMPESKQGWLPKTSYCVQVRTKKKSKDDMSDEAEIELYMLDGATFLSLDHANSRAMEEWVRLTYTIRSINLNERQCKLEEAKRELMMAFEDEGGQMFVQSREDDEKFVEVAVQPLRTMGPRN